MFFFPYLNYYYHSRIISPMKTVNVFFDKLSSNRFCILLIPAYALVYIPCFYSVDSRDFINNHVIHMALDDHIPFIEIFIIPYLMWFAYIIGSLIVSYCTDRNDYVRSFFFMASGMTVFIIISVLYPNCHSLRPVNMPRHNIFTDMIQILYKADAPANLLPSIHVFDSLGAHMAVMHNNRLNERKRICRISYILCISIIVSTLFIKQHSLFDVISALILAAVIYPFCYAGKNAGPN